MSASDEVRPSAPSSSRLRSRVWEILEPARKGDVVSHVFDLAMATLIALNVVALVIGTVPEIEARFGSPLRLFEIVSLAIFTIEYVARFWSSASDPRFRGSGGRLRWARTPLAIIDFLAVAPFLIPSTSLDLRFLRALRLFRVLRIAKLARYSEALQLLGRVAARKRGEIGVTFAVLVMLLLISSSLMYFAENEAQPEAFRSIPRAFWWGIVTLTTVGYGDVYPVTAVGKLIGAVVALLGIGLFALPAGILGSGFIEEMGRAKDICPHCGRDRADTPQKTLGMRSDHAASEPLRVKPLSDR